MDHCDPPRCRRPIGHRGRCHATWMALEPVCGHWMPHVKEPCARKPGHGYEHRSAYALQNASDADHRDYHA